MENDGATSAVKHFSSKWSVSINKYLEELKEVLKSKSGNKNWSRVYPYIKKSRDPTIALPPI